jgi:hypothetical protein
VRDDGCQTEEHSPGPVGWHSPRQADAKVTIEALRDWAAAMRADGIDVLRGYQQGRVPFPERLHIRVLTACYYKAIYDATIAFCDLAQSEIAGWDHTDGRGATKRTRELLRQLLADE